MSSVPFPRQAYYERIGAAKSLLPLLAPQGQAVPVGSPSVNMRFLKQLMIAHTNSIPFENIDVLLGRLVSIAPKDVYDKLIHARRGGYCFEQNMLFYEAMRDAGFTDIRLVAARVIWGSEDTPHGRSHMLSVVTLPAEDAHEGNGSHAAAPQQWMLDVGFGAAGGVPRAPLRLDTTEPQKTIAGVLRVRTRNPCPELTGGWSEYVVDLMTEKGWRSMYHFDLQPQYFRDFYMMNYLTTRESIFTGTLQASRAEGAWVPSKPAAAPSKESEENIDSAKEAVEDVVDYAVTTATGFTFVPRGAYTVAAFDATCRAAVKTAFAVPSESRGRLAEAGGLLEASQWQPSSPGELYDWLADKVQIDFNQTRLPQYNVSREDFVKAARERLVAFGGSGYKPQHHI